MKRMLIAVLILAAVSTLAQQPTQEAITNIALAATPAKVYAPNVIMISLGDKRVEFDVIPLDAGGSPVGINGQYAFRTSVTWAKFLNAVGSTSTPNQAMNNLEKKLVRWSINTLENRTAE